MPKEATSPAARLKKLQAARDRAKALGRGQVLTSVPMSELLKVSWPTLREWCDDVPELAKADAFVRGDRGIEWQFRPLKTVDALIKHYEARHKAAVARSRRTRAIVGGGDMAGADEDLSLAELAKMVEISTRMQDAKVKAGKLIDADRAATALRTFFAATQQAVLRAAQEQDPGGQWPPEIRESFEDATRSILLRIEQAGRKCLDEFRGGAA